MPGLSVSPGQASEILAQVGALIKAKQPTGPMAGLPVRKVVLGGTSATAGTLIQYLPAHKVFRTADMQHIYDGFLPTSNGSVIEPVDVPLIHVPTMHEVRGNTITGRQDGDAPGDQYRVYEFAGMGHIDSRDSARLHPDPCTQPVSRFPLQVYMSVALHHLFQWVDKGIVAPRSTRIWKDRDESDGSPMVLDELGNPRGGVRNTYVDVADGAIRRAECRRRASDSQPERLRGQRRAAGRQPDVRSVGLPGRFHQGAAQAALRQQAELPQRKWRSASANWRKRAGRCRSTVRWFSPTPPAWTSDSEREKAPSRCPDALSARTWPTPNS